MTDKERELLAKNAAHLSPVVDGARDLLDKMVPMPTCVVCPWAQWYRVEDDKLDAHLEAHCTAFHGIVYDRKKRAVTACDARTDAVEGEVKKESGG